MGFSTFSKDQENQSPVVTIVTPANNSKFQWNSILQYKISIDDVEDGKSEYDEIATNEVLLKVTYLPDSPSAKKYLQEQRRKYPLLQNQRDTMQHPAWRDLRQHLHGMFNSEKTYKCATQDPLRGGP